MEEIGNREKTQKDQNTATVVATVHLLAPSRYVLNHQARESLNPSCYYSIHIIVYTMGSF